ncbi:hypothetical protein GCM10018790_49800 [Kitasatospora xanthocidica]|uniref:RICIN domain-containing protein n=1 Tax=Kitasatospora xanthocidica TaxID=83382 RepID=UPI0016767A69|nr:RICIN domain-containing protein [Kitasatospora xanthocidica]GHF65999.1 hypothetical protein GCM10018790_49800 [Kitasatospora xanthocidica]
MNLVRRTLVPALGAALLLAVAAPTASADFYPPGWPQGPVPEMGTLVNANSGKCLEVADSSTDNGAAVQQWDCDGGENQLWDFNSGIPGAIVNVHSGKCLDATGGAGDPIQQWDCDGGDNQYWTWTRDRPWESYALHDGRYHLALDVRAWSTENGAETELFSWNDGDNQSWRVVRP